MSSQLDILALEPFHGGPRRQMLETLTRCSRHRWTVLKLPARRIERRLTAAAHWFAEQLSRHPVGKIDLLFVSEAMNLADLFRLVPALAKKPTVVYFHSNQLPEIGVRTEGPSDLVNLNTAAAATEIWFNSIYHLKRFVGKAAALVERYPDLQTRSPIPDILAKSRVMHPPMDMTKLHEAMDGYQITRRKRTIFLDTNDAHAALINTAFRTLDRRGESYTLITTGPDDELSADLPRRTIGDRDDIGQIRALHEAGVMLSAKFDAPDDLHVIRALGASAWPIVPASGVYMEMIPERLHESCLYEASVDGLVAKLLDFWHLDRPDGYQQLVAPLLHDRESAIACRAMDDRLAELKALNH
ncbi:MAG TPA: DUF3524 domain-containing protein [Tepidisphaeraceae bacterium]|jgi:hypothetical protein|nr:DUF3524 domain-containing protein [Tepidisphaeraceae bacterium]